MTEDVISTPTVTAPDGGYPLGHTVEHGSFHAWEYGDSSREEDRKFVCGHTVEAASAAPELSPGF